MKTDLIQHKKRKQKLGQFFTPREIVEFIFDMLKIYLIDEGARWKGKNPSVIDPACGEGMFLKVAIEKGFTRPDWVFGVDKDENVVKQWKEISLLDAFGGNENMLKAHFFHQDGLIPLNWEGHKALYFRKLKQIDIKNQQFDVVVGNPPFGGDGLKELSFNLQEVLLNYNIWKRAMRYQGNKQNEKITLFNHFDTGEKERLKKFPIELLFVERFIHLVKPGGHIAIIIPDGILANSNLNYVRRFIIDSVRVNAIVSLPRDTFKNVGTFAKTSILFLTKPKTRITEFDYPVFLSSVQDLGSLMNVLRKYEEECSHGKISQ